jgi:hypothetical protein
MKLPEDGPSCGPKLVAVIKSNRCKQLDWFIFRCCVDGQNTTNHDTQRDANSKVSNPKINMILISSVNKGLLVYHYFSKQSIVNRA